ncbi:protein transport protein SEC31 homolog B-like isoform X2 [Apium graveolens]|uniref:protein transport protein SEC31 homolog B-like isoform X2 n=1 Tax=Apium graveolens TaxID=4045 RepID=UPI003D78F853
MAPIKEVSRSATVAFSPDKAYFAAGTMAGAVDISFSTSANLDIFKLDFQSDDHQLPLVAALPSTEPFNRLSWGKSLIGTDDFSLGLIAGGLNDGNIGIWNPTTLISSEPNEGALLQQLSRHKGPVRGLEFNSISPNLLASGADESEICIWDIAKPTEPIHFPPLKGSGSATQGEISFLSWNRKVQHILASASFNGTTVVWDLRKQKPVISFSDSVKRRCSVLQWNPDVATQLILASDDDSSPSLRVWDMRNTMSPLKELVGHTKGVVAMSWSPNDSSYLLTCAKDNRTICWDIASSEIVSELPAGSNWNFDVHWYPKMPGVISASSFDGKIGIYNIEGCGRHGVEDGDSRAGHLRAPKWYKHKAGVSFGFGGKLVSCKSKDSSGESSEVFLQNLTTGNNLAESSSEFEAAMQSGERSSLKLLCDRMSLESELEDDKETWGFLKVMFEDDGTAQTKLLTHLGFSLPTEAKDAMQDILSRDVSALGIEERQTGIKETTLYPFDGEDFFNNLPSPKSDTPVSTSRNTFEAQNSISNGEEIQQQSEEQEETADALFDDTVQRALVVGDYTGAVAQCLSANRIADALVIAHVGGASLWEKTRDQYLKMSYSPYLKVVSAMVNNDLRSLVNTRPLKAWKETLVLLCTFAQREEWTFLCDALASRLVKAGRTLEATLCYICAGNIDKTVEIWSKSVTTKQNRSSYVGLLQGIMEKTMILAMATGQKRSASLCKLVEKYAEILASQGLLTTAMKYLNFMGNDELTPELVILRDCIALSTEPEREALASADFGSSQSQNDAYAANRPNYGVETPQNYYQEIAPPQLQTIQSSQESFNPSYSRGYVPPAPYQNSTQSGIFLPTQGPVASARGPDANPIYQAGIQNANLSYQAGIPVAGSRGPVPSQIPGTVVSPIPGPRGFTPISNTDVQRSGMGIVQPPSHTQTPPAPAPVAPPAPPSTVQTVDTSNVPGHQRPVITTLTRLFNETSEALGGARANPAKKREIEDNSKKFGSLFEKLNSGDISKNAGEKLVQLCQALDRGDFSTALQIQVLLTTSDWDECNTWLAALKRMIKTRQNVR